MTIVFATNNNHKLSEIQDILGSTIEVKSLKDIGCHVDIPETGTTLEENAQIKANYVWDNFQTMVFADDTGLEIDALNGEPGVYSARYAGGEGHDSEANIQKVLANLQGVENRKARFRTVIAFIYKDKKTGNKTTKLIEGIVDGSIITEKRGAAGFGYDAIFVPEGYDKTFGELGMDIKNSISHRARAVQQFAKELQTYLEE
jgi:non-canonical purine NTP pyrophosphatase, rdgB/HAM1 family